MAVHGYAIARLYWTDHGLQRFGSDGEGALRLGLRLLAATNGVGGRRPGGHDRHHGHRLPKIPVGVGGLHLSGIYLAAADRRFPVSRFAQYAPLDQAWRLLFAAFGTGETRN